MKKHYLISCLLFAALMLSNVAKAQDPNFYVYLCFGQSNMEGFWNQVKFEPEDLEGVSPRFKMMAAVDDASRGRVRGNWYTAVPPLCRPDCFLTPADYFGRTMVERLPEDKSVGVLMVAVGGISIKGFMKDESISKPYNDAFSKDPIADRILNLYNRNLYGTLVELGRKAQQDGVIKGIIMLQGEADTGDNAWPGYVNQVYRALLADLNLKASEVPLLAGETLYNGTIFTDTNVKNIDRLPSVIPTAHVISAEGCETSSDYVHFTAKGYRLIGRRFAAEELKILGYDEEAKAQMLEPYQEFYNHVHDIYMQSYREITPGAHSRLGDALDAAAAEFQTDKTQTKWQGAKIKLRSAVLTYIKEAQLAANGVFDLTFLLDTPDVSYSKIGATLPNAWYTDNKNAGTFHYVINNKVPWTTTSEPSAGFTAAYGLVSPKPATSGFEIYQKTFPLPVGTYKATSAAFGWGMDVNGTWKGTYPPHYTLSADETDGADVITENYNDVSVVFTLDEPRQSVKIGIKAHEGNDCPWTAMANTRLYMIPSDGATNEAATEGWTKFTSIPDDIDDWYIVLTDKDHPLMMGLAPDVNPYNNVITKSLHYQYPANPLRDHAKVWLMTKSQNWDWADGTTCYSIRSLSYPSLYLQTEWQAPWHYRTHDQPTPIGWTAIIPQYYAEGDYWTILNGVYPRANACREVGLNDINTADYGGLGPWYPGQFGDGSVVAANKKGDDMGHFEIYGMKRADFEDLLNADPVQIDDATAIHECQQEVADIRVHGAYDLMGRSVPTTDPLQMREGIYIIEGKKILIK